MAEIEVKRYGEITPTISYHATELLAGQIDRQVKHMRVMRRLAAIDTIKRQSFFGQETNPRVDTVKFIIQNRLVNSDES